jgi:hypothetical protein
MKKTILVLTLVLISFAFLSADVYVKTKTHTDAFEMMGQKQPAKDVTTEQWIAGNKFAQVSESQTMVIDLDKKVIYVIYHGDKTYVEAQLPLDIEKIMPDQLKAMMAMMKMTATVKPNGESKKIGQWNCKGYDITMNMQMMNMKMKSWVTTDVPFDWKTFRDKMFPHVMKLSGSMGMDDKSLEEFKKLEGFQVGGEVTVSVMGKDMKSTTEVMEINKKAAPAGIYSVPKGYKKVEKLAMKRGM